MASGFAPGTKPRYRYAQASALVSPVARAAAGGNGGSNPPGAS